jgi:hypothetical protein
MTVQNYSLITIDLEVIVALFVADLHPLGQPHHYILCILLPGIIVGNFVLLFLPLDLLHQHKYIFSLVSFFILSHLLLFENFLDAKRVGFILSLYFGSLLL